MALLPIQQRVLLSRERDRLVPLSPLQQGLILALGRLLCLEEGQELGQGAFPGKMSSRALRDFHSFLLLLILLILLLLLFRLLALLLFRVRVLCPLRILQRERPIRFLSGPRVMVKTRMMKMMKKMMKMKMKKRVMREKTMRAIHHGEPRHQDHHGQHQDHLHAL